MTEEEGKHCLRISNISGEYLAISSIIRTTEVLEFKHGKKVGEKDLSSTSISEEDPHKMLKPAKANGPLSSVNFEVGKPKLGAEEEKHFRFCFGAYFPQVNNYVNVTVRCNWVESEAEDIKFVSLVNEGKLEEAKKLVGAGVQLRMFKKIKFNQQLVAKIAENSYETEIVSHETQLKKTFGDATFVRDAWLKIKKFKEKHKGQIKLLKWRGIDENGVPVREVLYVLTKVDKFWIGNSLEELAEEEKQKGTDTTECLKATLKFLKN